MSDALTQSARNAITLAKSEARAMNHDFVGTEHVLLGLLTEPSCGAADVLQRLGISVAQIRGEIETLVSRGPTPIEMNDVPLTPRAKRVMTLASQVASSLSLSQIAPEHILIGLIEEPSGVAGVAMRNLGIDIRRLSAEALRTRFQQMRIIERIVRPVRATVKYKRKTREEMLLHLTAIYDEQIDAGHSPAAAQESAARRFGDPTELSRELQASLPATEKIGWLIEHWLAWRPGESVVRMMLRSSLLSFVILLLVAIVISSNVKDLLGAMSILLLVPATQFFVGVCYYRIRDCMWGAFGTRKSELKAVAYAILAALVMLAASAGVMPFMRTYSLGEWHAAQPVFAIVSLLTAVVFLLLAKFRGPIELRDTMWAMLDLNTAA